MKGIVIENSLKDIRILNSLTIMRSWEDGDWKLHEVNVSKEEAEAFSKYLKDGPWYIHFWNQNDDDVLVVFKNKTFIINHSYKCTWVNATKYGISIGIPKEQLDFPID